MGVLLIDCVAVFPFLALHDIARNVKSVKILQFRQPLILTQNRVGYDLPIDLSSRIYFQNAIHYYFPGDCTLYGVKQY